jgi:hypothetical protein
VAYNANDDGGNNSRLFSNFSWLKDGALSVRFKATHSPSFALTVVVKENTLRRVRAGAEAKADECDAPYGGVEAQIRAYADGTGFVVRVDSMEVPDFWAETHVLLE